MCAHPPLRFGCSPAAPACARLAPWLLGGVDAAPCGVAYHPLVACAQEWNSAPWPFGLAGWIPPLAQTATTPLRSLAPWRGGCRPLRGRLPPLSRLRSRVEFGSVAFWAGGVDSTPCPNSHYAFTLLGSLAGWMPPPAGAPTTP